MSKNATLDKYSSTTAFMKESALNFSSNEQKHEKNMENQSPFKKMQTMFHKEFSIDRDATIINDNDKTLDYNDYS